MFYYTYRPILLFCAIKFKPLKNFLILRSRATLKSAHLLDAHEMYRKP